MKNILELSCDGSRGKTTKHNKNMSILSYCMNVMSMNHRPVPEPASNDGGRTTRRSLEITMTTPRESNKQRDDQIKLQLRNLRSLVPMILAALPQFLQNDFARIAGFYERLLIKKIQIAFFGNKMASQAFCTETLTSFVYVAHTICHAGVTISE